MNFIDAHSHIWTPDTGHYPLAAGFRRANMEPRSFTFQELQEQMKPNGVNRVVLIQMSFYGYDNRYMLDAIKLFPGMFSGVAVIDQDNPQPADEMRKMKAAGVRGFRIYPKDMPVERWLEGDGLQQMFRVGAAENLAMCCLIDPDALPALSKACQKYPDTTVVIDHLCRIGASGTIHDADVQALCDMAKHKHTYVKVSAFYALGKKKPPYLDLAPLIKRVYDAFGPQRLMWATDCPFQSAQDGYKTSIDLVRHGLDFLSDADREWLLRKTAEKVYF
jgi:predicted TIM-barrel fold metal-dependent hydrolase